MSSLEAAKALRVAVLRSGRTQPASPKAAHRPIPAQTPAQLDQFVLTAPKLAPAHSPPGLSLAPGPQQVPAPAAMPMAPAEGAPGSTLVDHAYHQPETVTRIPGILIRGGSGGVDDKCDLHARGRPGIAINRSVPSLYRGGIR